MELCGVCGQAISEERITAALAAAPWEITDEERQEMSFYHLDCAVSDGSYITAEEVTDEDREHGVYWIQ